MIPFQIVGTGVSLAQSAQSSNFGPALNSVDFIWLGMACVLVAFMQIGFLLLECGIVRSKTTINTAHKNLSDLAVSVLLFWLIGYSLMFGPSLGGFVGFDPGAMAVDQMDAQLGVFLLFQALFCGTAATIVSGAVAERCSTIGFLAIVVGVALVVYPVMGHMIWGNIVHSDNQPFLASLGFMDYAGGTVVHGTGAWTALAAVLVIGPRIGRFMPEGAPLMIPGHNPVLSGAGVLLLMIGWMGFNGGAASVAGGDLTMIVMVTLIASVVGGIVGTVYSLIKDNGYLRVERTFNGFIGGLVAVTAGCDVLGMHAAVLLGGLGALVANVCNEILLRRFGVDDVVGAIGTHGFSGAMGTLMIAFVAPSDLLLAGSRIEQFVVQLTGVAICFVWAFGATWIVMKVLDGTVRFRVSADDEITGLNSTEHGMTLGTGLLQQMLMKILVEDRDNGELIEVEQGDESGELSELFNLLMLRMRSDSILSARRNRSDMKTVNEKMLEDQKIVDEIYRQIALASQGNFQDRIQVVHASGVLRSVCDGMNKMFDAIELAMQELTNAIGSLADDDLSVRMNADRDGVFGLIAQDYNRSVESLAEARSATGTAVSEITVESRQSADNASEALGNIEMASKQALAIVKIIDEIAAKTNVLALNASIEASRAGHHGAAFAVVADQVRRLSQRVADASSEIDGVISENRKLVGTGIEAVENVHVALQRIDHRLNTLTQRTGVDEAA